MIMLATEFKGVMVLGGWGCVAGCKQTSHHPCGYTQTPLAASLFAVHSPGNPKIRIETEGQNIRLHGEKNKKTKHRENLSQSFSKLLPLQETSEDICFIFSFYSVEFP